MPKLERTSRKNSKTNVSFIEYSNSKSRLTFQKTPSRIGLNDLQSIGSGKCRSKNNLSTHSGSFKKNCGDFNSQLDNPKLLATCRADSSSQSDPDNADSRRDAHGVLGQATSIYSHSSESDSSSRRSGKLGPTQGISEDDRAEPDGTSFTCLKTIQSVQQSQSSSSCKLKRTGAVKDLLSGQPQRSESRPERSQQAGPISRKMRGSPKGEFKKGDLSRSNRITQEKSRTRSSSSRPISQKQTALFGRRCPVVRKSSDRRVLHSRQKLANLGKCKSMTGLFEHSMPAFSENASSELSGSKMPESLGRLAGKMQTLRRYNSVSNLNPTLFAKTPKATQSARKPNDMQLEINSPKKVAETNLSSQAGAQNDGRNDASQADQDAANLTACANHPYSAKNPAREASSRDNPAKKELADPQRTAPSNILEAEELSVFRQFRYTMFQKSNWCFLDDYSNLYFENTYKEIRKIYFSKYLKSILLSEWTNAYIPIPSQK